MPRRLNKSDSRFHDETSTEGSDSKNATTTTSRDDSAFVDGECEAETNRDGLKPTASHTAKAALEIVNRQIPISSLLAPEDEAATYNGSRPGTPAAEDANCLADGAANVEEDDTVGSMAASETSEDAEDAEDTKYPVAGITVHRINESEDILELKVYWDCPGGVVRTWEPEEALQETAIDAVVKYWAGVEGGRLSVRPYEVFAIRGHDWLSQGKSKRRDLHLEVEWLGYKERTMEPWHRFSEDQPDLVHEYFESIGGRPKRP